MTSLFDMIDTRSFSNLWFWALLAITWTGLGQWVLSISQDLIARARAGDQDAAQEVYYVSHIMARRFVRGSEASFLALTAALSFALTVVAISGFVYDVELAQALFFLALPALIVLTLRFWVARAIIDGAASGEALYKLINRHRLHTYLIGALAIFTASLWGIYHNIAHLLRF